MVVLIKDMYSNFVSQVLTPGGSRKKFQMSSGVFLDFFLSPQLFNLFQNVALSLAKTIDGSSIGGKFIDKLA